jgi:ABC-type multidrug transport system fused ATPase/permease subunit
VSVELEDVWFAYDEGEPVLRSVNLVLPAGSNVAIVGRTGSGKSTLAKLLIRLADPSEGVVRLAGENLREVSAASRHRCIRLVPQDGFLFNTTIAENLRMGRPEASDADIEAAFDALGLGTWLASLPAGIDTEVGQRGEEISVGERQLVALARAELSDPGLLLLDEATSNVDPETEQSLGRALAVLSQGRTTVSVAHRLSTAEAADLVVVVEDGQVVQFGPHHELVAVPGIYRQLYESWVGNTHQAVS